MKNVILISQGAQDYTDAELTRLIKAIVDGGMYQIVLLVLYVKAKKDIRRCLAFAKLWIVVNSNIWNPWKDWILKRF